MKQSSKRLTSILGSLFIMIAALVIFFDLVQPEYGNIEQVKGQIAGENNLFQTETQVVTAAQKVISEYQQESQGQQAVAMALPTNQDVAGALAQVYGLAQNNGIVVQNLTISPPTIQAQNSSAGNPNQQSTTKPLGSFSLQMTAIGSYEGLKNFLSGIETNIRVFDLKGLSLTPGQATSHDFFSYNITVATYYQTH